LLGQISDAESCINTDFKFFAAFNLFFFLCCLQPVTLQKNMENGKNHISFCSAVGKVVLNFIYGL
jgi:hypothetical protein